jgi:hypothetical protein
MHAFKKGETGQKGDKGMYNFDLVIDCHKIFLKKLNI